MLIDKDLGVGVARRRHHFEAWKRERVKYYAQLAIKRFEFGVESVKELLSTLTINEWWGLIFKFEDIHSQKFAQLVADAPDWVEWMA